LNVRATCTPQSRWRGCVASLYGEHSSTECAGEHCKRQLPPPKSSLATRGVCGSLNPTIERLKCIHRFAAVHAVRGGAAYDGAVHCLRLRQQARAHLPAAVPGVSSQHMELPPASLFAFGPPVPIILGLRCPSPLASLAIPPPCPVCTQVGVCSCFAMQEGPAPYVDTSLLVGHSVCRVVETREQPFW